MALIELSEKKEAFVGSAGPKQTKKRNYTVRKASDISGIYSKILMYGDGGTGKDHAICDLLEAGEKIFSFSTDIGGDGITPTVRPEMIRRGKPELLENLVIVVFDNDDDLQFFFSNPQEVYPTIFDDGFTFLLWDGFTNWQMSHLPAVLKYDPDIQDSNGNVITLQYWGKVRDVTMSALNSFLYMHNRKTGKLWNKYMTMLEDQHADADKMANTPDPKERMKIPRGIKAPMVQGSAAKLIIPAFDIVLRCVSKTIKNEATGQLEQKFAYQCIPTEKQKAKVRGIKLNPTESAEFGRIWKMVKEQMGI